MSCYLAYGRPTARQSVSLSLAGKFLKAKIPHIATSFRASKLQCSCGRVLSEAGISIPSSRPRTHTWTPALKSLKIIIKIIKISWWQAITHSVNVTNKKDLDKYTCFFQVFSKEEGNSIRGDKIVGNVWCYRCAPWWPVTLREGREVINSSGSGGDGGSRDPRPTRLPARCYPHPSIWSVVVSLRFTLKARACPPTYSSQVGCRPPQSNTPNTCAQNYRISHQMDNKLFSLLCN